MSFWQELFKFLKSLVPNAVSFLLGYKVGAEEKQKLIAKKEALRVELERVENEKHIREVNASKSARQLIDEAIGESARFNLPKRRSDD